MVEWEKHFQLQNSKCEWASGTFGLAGHIIVYDNLIFINMDDFFRASLADSFELFIPLYPRVKGSFVNNEDH